ncbi:MAG TPA: hypothetical protein PK971_14855, partial [Saprospiraceae bacterium]|nr:hypothetical protein [Saprospiraceae bacterium]
MSIRLYTQSILLLLGLPWANMCLGQPPSAHTFRLDAWGLAERRIGGAYEWQPNRKAGIEVSADYERHQKQPASVFNGDQIVHFTLRSTDTIDPLYQVQLDNSTWEYLGSGQAFDILPEHISLSTLSFRLGYRFYFRSRQERWALSLQPGLSLRRHQHFSIRNAFYVENYYATTWTIEAIPYDLQALQRTYSYQQNRTMRWQETWHMGITYDLGISRKISPRLFAEIRACGGLNL